MRLYRDIDALPYLLRLLKFLLSRLEQTHLNLNEQIKTTGTAEHPIWPRFAWGFFPPQAAGILNCWPRPLGKHYLSGNESQSRIVRNRAENESRYLNLDPAKLNLNY